jgi:hypothetical protein
MAKKNVNVVVGFPNAGGFGDIVASASICLKLESSGISPFILYDYLTARDKLDGLFGKNRWQEFINSQPNSEIINIKPSLPLDTRWPQSKAEFFLREYDETRSEPTGPNTFSAGLGFNPSTKVIQSGLYIDPNAQSIIEKVMVEGIGKSRGEFLESILKKSPQNRTSEKLAKMKKDIINSKWSSAYLSELRHDWFFLDVLAAAEKNLVKPLYVFATTPRVDNLVEQLRDKAKQLGLNYMNPKTNDLHKTSSKIYVVEFQTIPYTESLTLNSLTDTLSLVTGDMSLTTMIQRAVSGNPIPFFYAVAGHKKRLFKNLKEFISESDFSAARRFENHNTFGNNWHIGYRNATDSDKEDMAKLVYDPEVITRFNCAVKGIKGHFVDIRREAGIKNPEILWSVPEAVDYVVHEIINGRQVDEVLSEFRPSVIQER